MQIINDDASSSSGLAVTTDNGDLVDIAVVKKEVFFLPPKPDSGIVPTIEWWDEPYLSRENREIRKKIVKLPLGSNKNNNNNNNNNSYSSSSGSGSGSGGNEADATLFTTASLSHAKSHM